MFYFDALLKFINTNNDNTIQKKEIQEFLKGQNENIFTEYFNSIDKDMNIDEFTKACEENQGKFNRTLPHVNFKNKEDEERYNQISNEIMWHDNFYGAYSFWFKSDEEFEKFYKQIGEKIKQNDFMAAEELLHNTLNSMHHDTKAIMERINTGRYQYLGNDFQDFEFEDADLTNCRNAFKYTTFNEKTFAQISQKNFPKNFNPETVFEKGKSIGLGIDDVHKMGYTGKGMSIAIIDSGTMCKNGKQHNALKFKEYNVASAEKNNPDLNNFHGQSTSYIAQEIAPDADMYYYAGTDGDGLVQNLQAIIDKNKTLPDDKKIRVVSMSFSLNGDRKKALEKVKELEAQGVWVFSCDEQFLAKGFGYLEKKDSMGNVNDFNNYQLSKRYGCEKIPVYNEKKEKIGEREPLYVNSGDRTVPDPNNENAFRHDSVASASWAIPVVAGYYTLACQANPKMNPKKFMELAYQTARTIKSTMPVLDKDDIEIGRTQETKEIKMIDIKALLQAIKQENNNK